MQFIIDQYANEYVYLASSSHRKLCKVKGKVMLPLGLITLSCRRISGGGGCWASVLIKITPVSIDLVKAHTVIICEFYSLHY